MPARAVVQLLDGLGFAPQPDARHVVVRLTRCPLLEAARRHPEIVCGVHLGIVRGALEVYGGEAERADLLAFSEPGACLLDLTRPGSPRRRAAAVTATRTCAPGRRRPIRWRRAGFVLPAALALLAGLDAALMLLGLPAPVTADRLPDVHGMLLVLGFVGTVVALERAVALRHPAGFAAPAALGLGGLLLISPAPLVAGRVALCLGALAMVGVYVPLWRRQRDDAVLVQAFGAVLAAGAALLWLAGVGVPVLLPWLVGFVVLTIGGERLELARLAMGPRAGSGVSRPEHRAGRRRRGRPAVARRRLSAPRARAARPGGLARRARRRAADDQVHRACPVRRGVPAGRLRLARGGRAPAGCSAGRCRTDRRTTPSCTPCSSASPSR